MPRVQVENVSKYFGRIIALEGIDLEVKEGEYVAILGPSGCGKTTLIKIIAGIWPPTDGRVLVDGLDVTRSPIEERDLGYVFQNIMLFPHMTVKDNAGFGPRVRGKMPEEIEKTSQEVLELVDLLDRQGFLPGELSGGAQQKTSLARALANRADLLILDEPLSALDARVRVELRYTLRRLVKDLKLTAIHVTHDQEEAMSVADRVVVMRKGRIVEIGEPRQLYEHPERLFTANFVGQSNFLEGRILRTKNGTGEVELRGGLSLNVNPGSLQPGEPVVLTIRPEHLELGSDQDGNILQSQVEDARFMGSFTRYQLSLANDEKVIADLPLEETVRKPGEQASVAFNREKLLVYPRPSEGLREALKLE